MAKRPSLSSIGAFSTAAADMPAAPPTEEPLATLEGDWLRPRLRLRRPVRASSLSCIDSGTSGRVPRLPRPRPAACGEGLRLSPLQRSTRLLSARSRPDMNAKMCTLRDELAR